jgi:hypothetical protein
MTGAPWIVETARKIRKTQFIIDGEAVVLGVEAFPQARPRGPVIHLRLPSLRRPAAAAPAQDELAQLLRGRAEGIFTAPFEQGEIGAELFEAACPDGA